MSTNSWQLRIALGACRAGWLLAVASLACALFALTMLTTSTTAGVATRILWSLAALLVLPALYLGVRLELDRGLFQRLAEIDAASPDDLAALDRAMLEVGLIADTGATRTLTQRVRGVLILLQRLGGVVAAQVLMLFLATV